jgi:hypothetical protein
MPGAGALEAPVEVKEVNVAPPEAAAEASVEVTEGATPAVDQASSDDTVKKD